MYRIVLKEVFNRAYRAIKVSLKPVHSLTRKVSGALLCGCVFFSGSFSVLANEHTPSPQTVVRTTTQNDITIAVESRQNQANNDTVAEPNGISTNTAKIQQGLLLIYRSNLLKKTYQHVVYPETSIDDNQQGDVVMHVVITRDGKVKSLEFETRAPFASLNRAAKRAIENAQPFPPAPKPLIGDEFDILMPIKFRLAD